MADESREPTGLRVAAWILGVATLALFIAGVVAIVARDKGLSEALLISMAVPGLAYAAVLAVLRRAQGKKPIDTDRHQ
jgi:hypothetical protein